MNNLFYKAEYGIKNTLSMLKRKIKSFKKHGLNWNTMEKEDFETSSQYYQNLFVSTRVNIIKKESLPGQNLCNPGATDSKAKKIINWLIEEGLTPQHRVVDYGCGSLRIGKELIPLLNKENYCGLDIANDFYEMGLRYISPKIIEEKKPFLGVISQSLLSQLKNKKWDFIIAKAVLPHIPKNELDTFFEQILCVSNNNTKIYLDYFNSLFNIRVGPLTYAHTYQTLKKKIAAHGFQSEILPWSNIKSYHKFIKITKI